MVIAHIFLFISYLTLVLSIYGLNIKVDRLYDEIKRSDGE